MTLEDWWSSATPAQKQLLCSHAETSYSYIAKLVSQKNNDKTRHLGQATAQKLNRASRRITPRRPITLKTLRPDIWGAQVGASA